MQVTMISNEVRTLADHARDYLNKAIEKYGFPHCGAYVGKILHGDPCDRYPWIGNWSGQLEGVDEDGHTSTLDHIQIIKLAELVEGYLTEKGRYV